MNIFFNIIQQIRTKSKDRSTRAGISEVVIDDRDGEIKHEYWNQRWKDSLNIAKTMLKEVNVKVRGITKETINGNGKWFLV